MYGCVYECVCVFGCVPVCVCVCMDVSVCMHVFVCIGVCVYGGVCLCVFMVCMGVCGVCVCVYTGHQIPKAAVTGSCVLPDMGAWNLTQVLYKNLEQLSHLSNSIGDVVLHSWHGLSVVLIFILLDL